MTRNPGAPTRLERIVAGLLLVLVATVVLRRMEEATFQWLMWADRDLVRSTGPAWSWPVMGAELSYGAGARVPGGAVHQLMGVPLALGAGPTGVYRFMLLLDGLGLVVLYAAARRWGPMAAAAAVAVAALSPIGTDNLRTLWNPGFLPLFVALGWAALLVCLDGRPRALVALGLVIAYAAQLHLSALLLGLSALLVLAVKGPAGLWRQGPLAAAASLMVYLPYLSAEAAQGWPNTRLLLGQRQVVEAVQPATTRFASSNVLPMLEFIGGFVAEGPLGRASGWVGVVGSQLVAGAVVLALVVAAWRRPREGRLVVGILVVTVLVLSYHLVDRNIRLGMEGTGRYLQVVVPALGLLTAAAVGTVPARLAAPVLLLGLGWQTWAWHDHYERDRAEVWEYRNLRAVLDAVDKVVGGGASGVVGRTLLLTRTGDRWSWTADDAVEWLLHEQGAAFPGSLPGPCAAVFLRAGQQREAVGPVDEATLEATLSGQPVIVRQEALAGGHRLVVYGSEQELCRTSLSDRYLGSPQEERMRQLYERLPSDEPVVVEPGVVVVALDGLRQVVGASAPRVVLLLEFGEAVVTLHSNQLRGIAHNADFFLPAMADINLTGVVDGRRVSLPFGGGTLGAFGLAPPVSIPVGGWVDLSITGVMEAVPTPARWPADAPVRVPFSVALPPMGSP